MRADGLTGVRYRPRTIVRQIQAFDGSQIVYTQDTGGDEMYDLYSVSADGESKNLTQTAQVSEVSPRFSPDGIVVFGSKPKASPWHDVAVMEWKTGAIRLLTHESDLKATWHISAWSPDGRSLYATREVEREDSDIYRIDVKTGNSGEGHLACGQGVAEGNRPLPGCKTLLLTSNERGGYTNVALMDLATKTMRWVTDTQWETSSGRFSPKGDTFTYTLNQDGRTAIEFVDSKTLKTSERGVPAGLNSDAVSPTGFRNNGDFLFTHQDSTHAANPYLLTAGGVLSQVSHLESAGMASAVLPGSQLVIYKSFDGRMISAFVGSIPGSSGTGQFRRW